MRVLDSPTSLGVISRYRAKRLGSVPGPDYIPKALGFQGLGHAAWDQKECEGDPLTIMPQMLFFGSGERENEGGREGEGEGEGEGDGEG